MTVAIVHLSEPFESTADAAPIAGLVLPFLTAIGATPKACSTRTLLRAHRGEFAARSLELQLELEATVDVVAAQLDDLARMLNATLRRAGRDDLEVRTFVVRETPS